MSKQEKEPLFSAKNRKFLTGPFSANNPVIVQILGICSALAVTVQLKPAIVMALSVTVVTGFSNLVMSLLRNGVPSRIRIIVQLVVIAALVILVDQVLKAYVYEVSKQLSVYVGLIITNCIVMGRIEAFALANKPWASLLDGIGNGLGYGLILVIVAFFRELFGSGSLLGFRIVPESWYIAEGGFYSNCGLPLIYEFHNALHDALYAALITAWLTESSLLPTVPRAEAKHKRRRGVKFSRETYPKQPRQKITPLPEREQLLNSRQARIVPCPLCRQPGAVESWYPQGDVYYGVFRCENHGLFPVRMSVVHREDGSWQGRRVVPPLTDPERAAFAAARENEPFHCTREKAKRRRRHRKTK